VTFSYDLVGNRKQMVDGTGTTVFGAVRSSTGSQPNEYQFAGEQVDASTGLQHLRERYYDMATGRFLGLDPLGEATHMPRTILLASLSRFGLEAARQGEADRIS
jgi:RHS repeat-associated protein